MNEEVADAITSHIVRSTGYAENHEREAADFRRRMNHFEAEAAKYRAEVRAWEIALAALTGMVP